MNVYYMVGIAKSAGTNGRETVAESKYRSNVQNAIIQTGERLLELKKFDLKQAKKLGHEEIMVIICEGLSEVALELSKLSNSKRTEAELAGQAATFLRLRQLFLVKGMNKCRNCGRLLTTKQRATGIHWCIPRKKEAA